MKSPVIWLTGIPGSGKTTFASELQKNYQKNQKLAHRDCANVYYLKSIFLNLCCQELKF